jgi:DNA-binding NarL/FixJ family response regulator
VCIFITSGAKIPFNIFMAILIDEGLEKKIKFVPMNNSREKTAVALPQVVIIDSNTLICIGMRAILADIIPFAEISIYKSLEEYNSEIHTVEPFHFFVGKEIIMNSGGFFADHVKKTIVIALSEEEESALFVAGYRTVVSFGPEDEVIKSLLKIHQSAHSGGYHGFERSPVGGRRPLAVSMNKLSEREKEVLILVVKGFINKEIAEVLNVAVTTVISHRKNISEKLDIKSPGKLAIYAVLNRLVSIDEIGMHN